jgi:NAD(P)H-flavin reductase/truncated hemoglobin YjbI
MSEIIFEGASYEVRDGESVLDALLRGGANIEFSCRKGTCQVCMLQVLDGDPGDEATSRLRHDLAEAGMFLPCCAHPCEDLKTQRPDPALLFTPLHLYDKEWLSSRVCRLRFEPERNIAWRPGQFVNLRRDDGLMRSYSVASDPDYDYFLTLHVKLLPTGEMSGWLCDELEPGDVVDAQGPLGDCFYDPEHKERDILMLGTGSGLAPLVGIARQALRLGHTGEVVLVHGSRHADGLYLQDELRELEEKHDNFTYTPCLSREPVPEDVELGRVTDIAFERYSDLSGWICYFAGIPAMVYEARYGAVLAGVSRADIHADPFEFAHDFEPEDKEKLRAIEADPELWEALDHGDGLMEIIRAFYDIVFEDPRLSPFFHRVTKRRAIEKQYSFLRDLFTGERKYFGLRPFNAHHWMIISDELFDYREAIFEECVRDYGLDEHLVRRWNAIHELFRREIVKTKARGMIVDGVEQVREGYTAVTIEIPTVCDGCVGEVRLGESARMHNRTGELFCERCSSTALH